MQKFFLIVGVLFHACSYSVEFSFAGAESGIDYSNSRPIIFNGQKKTLLEFVTASLNNPEDLFSVTKVIRFSAKSNTYDDQGFVSAIQHDTFQEILNNNCCYFQYFDLIEKNGCYVSVGAIVVGTTDNRLATKIISALKNPRQKKD